MKTYEPRATQLGMAMKMGTMIVAGLPRFLGWKL
jgi:hypothetical protein